MIALNRTANADALHARRWDIPNFCAPDTPAVTAQRLEVSLVNFFEDLVIQ